MAGVQGGVAFFRSPLASTLYKYPDLQMQMVCSLAAGVFKKSYDAAKKVLIKPNISLVISSKATLPRN